MLRAEITKIWTTLKPKLVKQKSYLEIYQNSDCLGVRLNNQNKPLVLELLAKHERFTFLSLVLNKDIADSGVLDLTSLAAIYRLSVLGNITKPFKLRCKVSERSGNIGFGFKSVQDSWQWSLVGNCETLYVLDKSKVSNKASRGESWNGISPVVDEIRWT